MILICKNNFRIKDSRTYALTIGKKYVINSYASALRLHTIEIIDDIGLEDGNMLTFYDDIFEDLSSKKIHDLYLPYMASNYFYTLEEQREILINEIIL